MAKRRLIYRLVLFVLFVIGFGMVVGGICGISYVKRIDKEYVTTEAKIEKIRKYTKYQRGKKRTQYDVLVSYVANGQVCTERLNAFSSFMQTGDSIQLKYNPQKVTEVHSVEIEYNLFVVMIIAGIIILVSDWFMPRLFRKLKIID